MKKTQQKTPKAPRNPYAGNMYPMHPNQAKEVKELFDRPNVGSMLARLRWDKASTEERKRVNEMLLKARAKKRGEKK